MSIIWNSIRERKQYFTKEFHTCNNAKLISPPEGVAWFQINTGLISGSSTARKQTIFPLLASFSNLANQTP